MAVHTEAAAGALAPCGVHPDQTGDYRQVAGRIREEAGLQPQRGNQQPGYGRSDHPGQIERAGAERDRVHEIFALDDLRHESLACRYLERGEQAEEDRQSHDPLDRDQIQGGQHAQGQRLQQHQALEYQDELPLVDPVGNDAAIKGKQQNRQRAQRRHQSHRKRRVGQVQHQPSLGDGLHPGAAQRDELSGQEQAEVAVSECGEDGLEGERRHEWKVGREVGSLGVRSWAW